MFEPYLWACSSPGRAPHSHCGGKRFEPAQVHQVMSIEKLREQIKKLSAEREKAQLEKGFAAEDNKDLRENFAYDYWVSREDLLTAKIGNLIKEIIRLTKLAEEAEEKKSGKKVKPTKPVPITKIKDLPKHTWF